MVFWVGLGITYKKIKKISDSNFQDLPSWKHSINIIEPREYDKPHAEIDGYSPDISPIRDCNFNVRTFVTSKGIFHDVSAFFFLIISKVRWSAIPEFRYSWTNIRDLNLKGYLMLSWGDYRSSKQCNDVLQHWNFQVEVWTPSRNIHRTLQFNLTFKWTFTESN